MNPPSSNHRRLMAAVLLLLTVGLIVLALTIFRDTGPPLAPLREAAQVVLSNSEERGRAAVLLSDLALPLFDEPGPVGSAAMLYYIGVAPLAGADLSIASIPPAKSLFEIETRDLITIARLLYQTQRLGPADQILGVVLQNRSDHRVDALQAAIAVRMELGRDAEVMQHTEEWIHYEPANPRPWRVQMMVHRNHGRWDNFIGSAEKAVELTSPTDWVLQVELMDGYTQLGQTADARREFDRIKAARPDLVEMAPIAHSRLLLQEGHYKESDRLIRDFLQLAPDDTEALVALGKLQFAMGNYSAAIETFERVKAIDPADEQAYYQLGQTHARAGNRELGAEFLQQHRTLLDAKIQLYDLEQQAAREPYNADVRRRLAMSYQQIGLPDLAEFWLRAAQGVTATQ